MDGLFKKTMSYLNSEGVVQDEFVGRVVEVASIKLKILRKIAEGENFFMSLLLSLESPRQFDIEAITRLWAVIKTNKAPNFSSLSRSFCNVNFNFLFTPICRRQIEFN